MIEMKLNDQEINFLQDPNLIDDKLIFDGEIMRLYVNRLRFNEELIVERELIHRDPAVGILAVTDQDQVVLVKQYRYAACKDMYEIPAGMIDRFDGLLEDPLDAARRELEEETHYRSEDWQELMTMYPSPGFLNEKLYLFYARHLIKVDQPLAMDEDEDLEIVQLSRHDAAHLLESGQIQDAKTIIALQYWLYGQGD